MCGIAGIVDFSEKDNSKKVDSMLKTINFRGPDSKKIIPGSFFDIGMVRLSIIDLSEKANQPFISEDGNIITIYNGEIYNFEDLKKTYFPNHSFSSSCDGEVIPALFQKFGIDFIKKIKGMFSICIIDKAKQETYLIRDRFGIKPLYYYLDRDKKLLIFASEIQALFENKINKLENYSETLRFFQYGLTGSTAETWFKNIYQIKAGQYLKYSRNKFYTNEYYKLEDYVFENDKKSTKYFELENNIFELIEKSLKQHSISDQTLGLHISGGSDSSLIASACKKIGLDTECFTFDFEESEFSEVKNAKKISDILKFKHSTAKINNADLVNEFEKNVNIQYEPFTSLRVLSQNNLYEKYKNSCKVILDGCGGDEIGAGYKYQQLAWTMDMISDGYEKIVKKMQKKNEFLDDKIILTYLEKVSNNNSNIHEDGISFERFKFLDLDRAFKDNNILKLKKPFKSNLRNAQYHDLMYKKIPRTLRYADRASMRSSVETRLPLLDHELVEKMFSVPTKYKMINGIQRFILKRYSSKVIGKDLVFTNKKSIADPQTIWLKKYFKDYSMDILNSKSSKEDQFIDYDQCTTKFSNFFKSKNTQNSFYLFQCLSYLAWRNKVLKA